MPHNTSTSSIFGRLSARSSFISSKEVKITIQLLNDSDSIINEFKRSSPAQEILDYVCELKNINEKDYLGLRYQDENRHRYWVDLAKPISHITKLSNNSLNLRLRFRYYPAIPSHLREACTRYQLFVQLQRDLLHGRLYCPHQKAAELAGLILQAQLGDFDENEHQGNYVSQFNLLLKQTPRIEEKIAECHKSFKGLSVEEAELQFLESCSAVDTYGFDPFTVKDPRNGLDVFIGVNHLGILIFQASQKIHSIAWDQLSKVDYIGKELRVIPVESYLPKSANGDSKEPVVKDKKSRTVLKFTCPSGHFAKHLWNHILSQQAFFNEKSAVMVRPRFSKPRIPLLSRGSTFRYPSQRVQREIEDFKPTESNGERENASAFVRYELTRHAPRKEEPWLNNATLPRLEFNQTAVNTSKDIFDGNISGDSAAVTVSPQAPPVSLKLFGEHKDEASNSVTPVEINVFHPKENTTSFSVHLVKFEKSPSSSPLPAECLNDSSVVGNSVDGPLFTSTPLFSKSSETMNGFTGKTTKECSSPEAPIKTTSRLINLFFTVFLVLLLLLAFSIAVFERREGSDWIESFPWLSHIRHDFYDPARHHVLLKYNKIFTH